MYPEVLPEANRVLIPYLKKLSDFTLAGGTALALQLGHRVSVDYDFFSPALIDKKLFQKLKTIFKGCSITPLINTVDELTVLINDVKFTFLYYPYPTLGERVIWSDVTLFSVPDIAAMKAHTIGQRSTYKDYFDIYTILEMKKMTLTDIVILAEKTFGDEFNGRIFLEQLLYHDDLTDTDITLIRQTVSANVVFDYLAQAVASIKL
ncbi:MAG: nucleotidyl transferase AbiEii/AbiGii toxin family protein [Patescibacteria group bacterium]|jgi:hypothetical protein